MCQRLRENIQNALVDVGILPDDFERDFLAYAFGEITHDPGEAPEKLLDGNHADLHDRFLQVAQYTSLKCKSIGKLGAKMILGKTAIKIADRLGQHRFRDDQLAHKIHYVVDA